jgi:hypothetical protein
MVTVRPTTEGAADPGCQFQQRTTSHVGPTGDIDECESWLVRTLIVSELMTLDGVVQAPGGVSRPTARRLDDPLRRTGSVGLRAPGTFDAESLLRAAGRFGSPTMWGSRNRTASWARRTCLETWVR